MTGVAPAKLSHLSRLVQLRNCALPWVLWMYGGCLTLQEGIIHFSQQCTACSQGLIISLFLKKCFHLQYRALLGALVSDHAMVSLNLVPVDNVKKSTRWRFNSSLLQEDAFKAINKKLKLTFLLKQMFPPPHQQVQPGKPSKHS